MKIIPFPNLVQAYNYNCGATALEAVLGYYGISMNQGKIMRMAGTTKAGTPAKGILKILRRHRLKYKAGAMTIEGLRQYLKQGIPVIILIQAWAEKKVDYGKAWKHGHYVVAIGYDKTKLYFGDPASMHRDYLTFGELKQRWHDVDIKGRKFINWGIAVYGKKSTYNPKKIVHMD